MERGKGLLFVAVLAALLSFEVAACGGEEVAGTPPPAETGAAGAEPPALAEPAEEQVLRWALGSDLLLDPHLSTDVTSAKIEANIFEGLVKLGDDLQPVPALAESWDVEGPKITFNLRQDGRWTNGDPVTAKDFEYSWKRILDPKLAAGSAYQLWGIRGAFEYNTCEKNCEQLRNVVAVKAMDDYTFEVILASEQPWFLQQMTHNAFLPVHQATVEQFGDRWTVARNIVTNGPFKVASFEPGASLTLVKNEDWHDAGKVALDRVECWIITDGATAVAAFEAGEVDALDEQISPADRARLKKTVWWQLYPGLRSSSYGFNVKNVPDVTQRRAMSLAIDRQTIIDNVLQTGEIAATGWTPQGTPGFDVANPNSPWTPAGGDMEQAKRYMNEVQNPVKKITLYTVDAPGSKEAALAIQASWKEIGIDLEIKIQEFQQFLELIGPPPNEAVDVFFFGWTGDYVDAVNFLELLTCDSRHNSTKFCDPEYDELVTQARATADNEVRYALYGQMEQKLFGPDGSIPIIPLWWGTHSNLERESIQDTFNIDLLDLVDLTKVVFEE